MATGRAAASGPSGACRSGRKRPWRETWFIQAGQTKQTAWRAVEAQHIVATMRLVDTLDEQAVLERLLDESKPPLPAAAAGRHYLLATPFRYRAPHGSRFRRGGEPGVWYGADSVRTACAEVAYWRWRFLTDSDALADSELLTQHTVFAATVDGRAIDLTAAPWRQARTAWTDERDYTATQALADAARGHRVQWVRYESVRDPDGRCVAVLDAAALTGLDVASQQTWHCRTTAHAVRMVHGEQRHEWTFGAPGTR